MTTRERNTLDAALAAEYSRGLAAGLGVARRIVGWLTRQPDTQWQRETREWAERAIAEAEEDQR